MINVVVAGVLCARPGDMAATRWRWAVSRCAALVGVGRQSTGAELEVSELSALVKKSLSVCVFGPACICAYFMRGGSFAFMSVLVHCHGASYHLCCRIN